jgi:hypothetical protein
MDMILPPHEFSTYRVNPGLTEDFRYKSCSYIGKATAGILAHRSNPAVRNPWSLAEMELIHVRGIRQQFYFKLFLIHYFTNHYFLKCFNDFVFMYSRLNSSMSSS